jgi:phytanoyl-CoA hydroxylase
MYIFFNIAEECVCIRIPCSAFLATDPLTCTGVWLAIEDATIANGCLHAAPRSHVHGVQKRMTRGVEGGVAWADGKPDFSDLKLEPLEVAAGSLVVLHGENVHGSSANTSGESRHAYSMHVVEGADGVQWLEDNWLQRPAEKPFEPLFGD